MKFMMMEEEEEDKIHSMKRRNKKYVQNSGWKYIRMMLAYGHTTSQVSGFSTWQPGLEPRSDHMGFVVNKVAIRQVFSEYFGFPCQFAFHRLLHNHHHHHLSSGSGTIGQTVAAVPSGLSLNP
jgi:hypothetical protein